VKRLLALLVALCGIAVAEAAAPLLSPPELDAVRAQPTVRVVDIRDQDAYAAGHIPGAVSAPYGEWRGPGSNPGELPPLPKLVALVQRLGLAPSTHVVVVSSGDDASDFGASARVYWTLKALGLTELSILNGGHEAWVAAKLPQDAKVPAVEPGTYAPPSLDARLVATRADVLAAIERRTATLVDARPPAFFNGDTRAPAAKLAGTLKGAVSLPFTRWFDGDSAALDAQAARGANAALPSDAGQDTVAFCNTGHWASIDWFALSEVAGRKNVKLYPGSMVDWTQDAKRLPMDNVPNRAKQLWIDAKLWAARTFN
jgi:thiosulfate/3-mercaptopyruvate sulfurtransferase